MTDDIWTVNLTGQAKKFDNNLSSLAKDAFFALLKELKVDGPYRIKLA